MILKQILKRLRNYFVIDSKEWHIQHFFLYSSRSKKIFVY